MWSHRPLLRRPPPAAAVAFGGGHPADRGRCILAPLSVVAVWTKNLVTDTDRYMATVAPLADDPAIQNAVADKITVQIFTHLDVVGITNQAVDALAERGLPPLVATQLHARSEPLVSAVESFVRTEVGKVVASDAFSDAWLTANRLAHSALVAALTVQTGEGVTVENDTLDLPAQRLLSRRRRRPRRHSRGQRRSNDCFSCGRQLTS